MARLRAPWVWRKIIRLLREYLPLAPEGVGKVWHDQIKGFLFMLGVLVQASPVPEYPVPSPSPRGGTGRIDMVWLVEGNPAAAFEIEAGIAARSVKKLEESPAPWKFILSTGLQATELKMMGSARVAGTEIRHIVIDPTDDEEVSRASTMEALSVLLEVKVEAVKEPKPTTLDIE